MYLVFINLLPILIAFIPGFNSPRFYSQWTDPTTVDITCPHCNAHRFLQTVVIGGGTGVDQFGAGQVAVSQPITHQLVLRGGGQPFVVAIGVSAEFYRVVAAIVLRHFLFSNVGPEGGGDVVSLVGQFVSVLVEGRVAQVGHSTVTMPC